MKQLELFKEENKCGARSGCNNQADEPHACPYAEEINDNNDPEYCICCNDCRIECSYDI